MEQHYLETEYMNDLHSLINAKTHEALEIQAEYHVVKNLAKKIKEECDALAVDLKKVEGSEEPDEKKEWSKLSEEMIKKWTLYKFYQDRLEILDKKIVIVSEEMTELQFQKMHMEEVHLKE